MAEEKIRVKIKPLKGIGGVGEAGDVVWMTPEDAEMYFRDGFVEYVSDTPDEQTPKGADVPEAQTEDHAVMKPQNKRRRK